MSVGQRSFKLLFSSRMAKSECFGLLFKSEKMLRCQVRMQGVRNGVRGIRGIVMACWVVSGQCQCFELVSGWCQCFSVPYCCWHHLADVFMYSHFSVDVIKKIVHVYRSSVPGQQCAPLEVPRKKLWPRGVWMRRSWCGGKRTCVRVGFQPYEAPWKKKRNCNERVTRIKVWHVHL